MRSLVALAALATVALAFPTDPEPTPAVQSETTAAAVSESPYAQYVGERQYPLPFKTRIAESFKLGQTIHAVGILKEKPVRVDFNFHKGNGELADIPLHVSIRFDEGFFSGWLVYNTFTDGNWSTIEQRVSNPFKPSEEFDLRVRILEGKFQIFGNRKDLGFFEMRKPLEGVDHVSIKGDLKSLSLFHYGGIINKENVYSAQAPLAPGRRLDVSGLPTGRRVDIGLFRANKEYALQVSIRFDENAVVRNGMNNFVWGKEEREGGLPLKKGEIFDVTLVNEEFSVQILLNGKRYATFQHRGSPTDFVTMSVEGNVDIHSVTVNNAR